MTSSWARITTANRPSKYACSLDQRQRGSSPQTKKVHHRVAILPPVRNDSHARQKHQTGGRHVHRGHPRTFQEHHHDRQQGTARASGYFTKTHKQGHSKYGPWDSGNDEKANVDRLVFVTKAADTGGIQSSQPGAMFQHILTDTTKRMTALSHGHTLMAAAAMAAQDRHAGAKFLEPRHHHHWQTTDEFNHGNTADGTAIGRAGPHYTTTRAATGPNKATSVLVRQRPRVRLLTIGQVPAGIR